MANGEIEGMEERFTSHRPSLPTGRQASLSPLVPSISQSPERMEIKNRCWIDQLGISFCKFGQEQY